MWLLAWGLGVSSFPVACGGDTGADGLASSGEPGATSPGAAEQGRHCAAGPSGALQITTQAELDALEGCETLDASVYIAPMSGSLDLRPLARLRRVNGQFLIGCNPFAGLEANCTGYSDAAVTSLDGLNSLEEAGRLQLAQVRVRTLAPLAALKRVGFIGIASCADLVDLAGLGQLEALDGLELTNNPDLQSLDGLARLPGLGALVLDANPVLVDIDALGGSLVTPRLVALSSVPVEDLSPLAFESVTDFHLGNTRARHLDGLGLRDVSMLTISDNPVLEQVDALGALESFGSIILSNNARLSRLPEFARVSELFSLSVSFNPALAVGPAFPSFVQGRSSSIIFEGNPALTRLDGFRSLAVGGYISVIENAALRELDLSSLEQVDSLRVLCNPELSAEALAPLNAVRGEVTLPGDSADACLLL